jgi:hypothetical protein
MTATSRFSEALFEWRLPRLAVDRLDDFEREADLPFLCFASAGAEKGHAIKMTRRTAVNRVNGLGDCGGMIFPLCLLSRMISKLRKAFHIPYQIWNMEYGICLWFIE